MASYIIEKDKLKGEYGKAFDRVEGYTMVRSIDNDTVEEMLMNLVDMLYSAQNDNKPVEKIVGKDIDKFCAEYFSAYRPAVGWFKSVPYFIYCMSACFFAFCLLDIFFPEEGVALSQADVNVFPFLFCVSLAVIISSIYTLLGKFIWKKYKNVSSNLLSFINVAGIILTVVACAFSDSFFDMEINVPLIYMTIASGLVAVGYKSCVFYGRYRIYGSIKKPKKDGSLKDIFEGSFDNESGKYPIELKKQYIKKNEKLGKRGKEQMSPADYMDFLRTNNKKLEKNMFYLGVFYILTFIISVYLISDGRSMNDTIVFAVILAVCLSAVYILFYKMNKMLTQKNRELLDLCDDEGITVIELADRIEERENKKNSSYVEITQDEFEEPQQDNPSCEDDR